MTPSIDFPVTALLLTKWRGELVETDTGWAAYVSCCLVPVSNGTRLVGVELTQLQSLGYIERHQHVIDYPAGDAPAATKVGADMLQWVGQKQAAEEAAWVGKTATAYVEDSGA